MATEACQRGINGTIEIVPLARRTSWAARFSDTVETYHRYIWRPPSQIKDELPEWFTLELDCYTTNGVRRFTTIHLSDAERASGSPGHRNVSHAMGLSLVASLGGHALLAYRGEADNKLLSKDESRIYLQYIQHRQEYFGKRKALDLGVARGGSDFPSGTVLPEGLGLGPDGQGKSWGIRRLMREGRAAAPAAGMDSPTQGQIQSLGLTEAAKLNPLHITSAREITSIVRMALFALPSKTKPTQRQIEYVTAHVRDSLHQRIADSDEAVNKWIEDHDSNLVHRITKRQDCKMDRHQVRTALLELGWRSMQKIGKCIDAQMRAFRDAIPTPLNARENRYFGELFLANKHYANLPLVLLFDRHKELQPAIVDVWTDFGDRGAISVLHRVMSYYATIYANRRAADRKYKHDSVKNKDGRIAKVSSDGVRDLPARPKIEESLVLQVAGELASERGIECEFGDWEATSEVVSHGIRIELRRAEPLFTTEFVITRAQFREIAERIRDAN